MASPASFRKHPIHPILVTFPIGLWIFSLVCDVIFLLGWGGLVWKDVAYYTMGGGIAGALLAAVPGLVDLLSMSDPKVKKLGVWHMSINLLAVGLFAVNFLLRRGATPEAKLPLALSALGVVLIGISGWLGGEMVYVHGVAVEPQRSSGRG
jgi:uncharacterized membrane protein